MASVVLTPPTALLAPRLIPFLPVLMALRKLPLESFAGREVDRTKLSFLSDCSAIPSKPAPEPLEGILPFRRYGSGLPVLRSLCSVTVDASSSLNLTSRMSSRAWCGNFADGRPPSALLTSLSLTSLPLCVWACFQKVALLPKLCVLARR